MTRSFLTLAQEAPVWTGWLDAGAAGLVLVAILSGKLLYPWWARNDDKAQIEELKDEVKSKDAEVRRLGDLFLDTARSQATAMERSASSLQAALEELRRRDR
jgi:hypothetical protein